LKGRRKMSEISYPEVKTWPKVDMFRGIRMKYKGKDFCFPAVYIGPSEMDDFENARCSTEYMEAKDDMKESVATKKAITLCARVLLQDGYEATDEAMTLNEKYEERKRERHKLEKKMADTNDETTLASLRKKLEDKPELKAPEKVFPNDDAILTFGISHMAGKGTRMVDFKRILQAYSKLNYFEQEEVEDFMSFPG
jgi:hypothetical protein